MARYKVLKSVAHGFAHSFASLMNYVEDDYVLGHLLTQARATRQPTLAFNILTGAATPTDLLTRPVQQSLESHRNWFPRLIRSHRTDLRYVRSARMHVSFHLGVERPARHAPGHVETPFVCRVDIEDDRGKVWTAEIKDWWSPESSEPTTTAARRGPRLWQRLLRLIRGWWSPRPRAA